MLKGKKLYARVREFADTELVPALNKDLPEEDVEAVLQEGVELGVGLLVDIADSLNKIATKVG